MSVAFNGRCPNPDVYLHKMTRKHLDRSTDLKSSVITCDEYKDPRLYVSGVLPCQDLDAQERAAPGRPIFQKSWKIEKFFQPPPPGTRFTTPGLTKLDIKSINREWINFDKDVKKANTMKARTAGWSNNRPVNEYKHNVGFPKMPCFDPAPYNETGFPMSPRMMSTASAGKNVVRNTRTFAQPFNVPNEMQHAVGLGGHEEDSYHTKSQHGFGDIWSRLPHVNFLPEKPKPRGTGTDQGDFASALLPPPRFLQTAAIMSPRTRKQLIAMHDEDGDGQMDSEELAAAPTHVREFMAKNKIGPPSPATKHLPRGSLTFTPTGPLVTPRRTHLLAHDRGQFSDADVETWRAPRGGASTARLRADTVPRFQPSPPEGAKTSRRS